MALEVHKRAENVMTTREKPTSSQMLCGLKAYLHLSIPHQTLWHPLLATTAIRPENSCS